MGWNGAPINGHYKWVTWVMTPLSGLITLFITGFGHHLVAYWCRTRRSSKPLALWMWWTNYMDLFCWWCLCIFPNGLKPTTRRWLVPSCQSCLYTFVHSFLPVEIVNQQFADLLVVPRLSKHSFSRSNSFPKAGSKVGWSEYFRFSAMQHRNVFGWISAQPTMYPFGRDGISMI